MAPSRIAYHQGRGCWTLLLMHPQCQCCCFFPCSRCISKQVVSTQQSQTAKKRVFYLPIFLSMYQSRMTLLRPSSTKPALLWLTKSWMTGIRWWHTRITSNIQPSTWCNHLECHSTVGFPSSSNHQSSCICESPVQKGEVEFNKNCFTQALQENKDWP